jgi:phosphoribosyl-ATP pyrophosphohydrolase/phosphoribosyl-AMP cyclohydrolase/histidinol dehydrogenase
MNGLPDVRAIVEAVRRDGDAALRRYAREFGDPPPRRVGIEELRAAYERIDQQVAQALERTRERIERFARAQRAALSDIEIETGDAICGHRAIPVRSAGIYVPGGRHPLPSSLLMGVAPARVAGVERIVVVSPSLANELLAAAHVAGVQEMYVAGGAQAIAALAYGSETVAPVDLIAGPGNAYVTAAKREVYGICGIDALAGPSEVMVVASDDADPRVIAADLLAQAEHDVEARTTLIAQTPQLAAAVMTEMTAQLSGLATAETARAAVQRHGETIVASLDEAVGIANRRAPEHLELHGSGAVARWRECTQYGALFVGAGCAEVLGDYGAGPNHVLPTGGSARFSAGLSVFTFLNVRTYMRGAGSASQLVRDAQTLASVEGLDAHRAAAAMRA